MAKLGAPRVQKIVLFFLSKKFLLFTVQPVFLYILPALRLDIKGENLRMFRNAVEWIQENFDTLA